MVSVGLYKAAVEAHRNKTAEVEIMRSEMQSWRQKYSSLEVQFRQKEKAHSNSLLKARQQEAAKQDTQKRMAQLEAELLEERQSREVALEAARQESAKYSSTLKDLKEKANEVADLKFLLQESGHVAGKLSAVPKTPATSMKPYYKENPFVSPPTASRTPSRLNKFSFVKSAGGRKGLSQRVQAMRSPRASQTIVM